MNIIKGMKAAAGFCALFLRNGSASALYKAITAERQPHDENRVANPASEDRQVSFAHAEMEALFDGQESLTFRRFDRIAQEPHVRHALDSQSHRTIFFT